MGRLGLVERPCGKIMRERTAFTIALAILFCLPAVTYAGKDFDWEPIPESNWSIGEDPEKGIHAAVVLFERVTLDDRDWLNKICYSTLHQRIRILSAEGRGWSDIVVPYIGEDQEIEDVRGRTVLPDGREFYLDKSQVSETEIFSSEGLKIKRKSFSLPAVSDDCIIEYYVKYRLKDSPNMWVIQKEIFMIEAEYVWKFYKGEGLSEPEYAAIADRVAPNYIVLNAGGRLAIEKRPSVSDPDELVFSARDIPAFRSEPHSLPDNALKWVVHHYYGQSGTPAAFWSDLDAAVTEGLDQFAKDNKQLREAVAGFEGLATRDQKITAAYRWLQETVVNTFYSRDGREFEDNQNLDDVMKHRYGTPVDINQTFREMLREMNIDAKIAFTVGRDENVFLYEAKYWQFDRSLVAVLGESGEYEFYNPGDIHLPPGAVAWSDEVTPVFIAGDVNRRFSEIEASEPWSNRISRHQMLKIGDNLEITGNVIEKHEGQAAYQIRRRLTDSPEGERVGFLRDRFSECFPNSEADSFDVQSLEDPTEPVTVTCTVKIATGGQKTGDRLLLRPYDLFSRQDNPFESKERRFPIMFDYAWQLVETVNLDLGQAWTVEVSPPDSAFSNPAGECLVDLDSYGTTLSIQRMFSVNRPIWDVSEYAAVRELFKTREAFEDVTIVLRRIQPDPGR